MTERLYYRDSELLEFEARIIECAPEGDSFTTILDRTAFYPTSGGQPHDLGRLGEHDVIDVIEDGSEIKHMTKKSVGQPGETIKGEVDSKRRQHFRQQHTAQHILSQVFHRHFDLTTMSVHLGDEYTAIEFNTDSLFEGQIEKAELFANDVIEASLPVTIEFVASDRLSELPLRKIPKRTGEIRVIKIGEYECSACGGTHCNSTSEVLLLKIIAVEKIRKRVLVKFLAGARAVQDYRARFTVTNELARLSTCHFSDLGEKWANLDNERRELKKQVANLQKNKLPIEQARLESEVRLIGAHKVVTSRLSQFDPKLGAQLATSVAESIQGVVLLLVDSRIIIATDPKTGLKASALTKQIGAEAQLKGGGSATLAQLGGADMDALDEYAGYLARVMADA